jgi:hypothetical protein
MRLLQIVTIVALACSAFNRQIQAFEGKSGTDLPKEIIEKVAAFEKMYDDIEFDATYTMRWDNESMHWRPSEFISSIDDMIHIVYQGKKYRFESKGSTKNLRGETTRQSEIVACDGFKTISLIDGKLTNIVQDRVETPSLLHPHSLLFHWNFFYFPLSLYLQGKDALMRHPQAGAYRDEDYKLEYIGKEYVQGLECVKIRDSSGETDESKEEYEYSIFWLAIQRNYIPVKKVSYSFDYSRTEPCQIAQVERFEEISPGLWFPAEVKTSNYSIHGLIQGKMTHSEDDTYTIKNIRLHPDRPDVFFEKIDIPKDAYIYHIKDGKIVRSEHREADPPARSIRRIGPVMIVVLILAPSLVLGIYWYYQAKSLAKKAS